MTQYALNDRGSLDLVTDDYYDTEILRLVQGLRFDREQMFDGVASLVPEPDNPISPESIAVRVNGLKIGRMNPEDSRRYWSQISRVVASGYEPVVPIRMWVTMKKWQGQVRLDTRAVLSISRPDMLFPINACPIRSALLPQGPTLKVLDEKDHAEYLHEILPVSGEGRVILTLEANHVKLADGTEIDSVDVLHDRKVVGRLSTQMSEQLAPIVRYAFSQNKLTAAWGSIRGNAFELSLTVQTARANEIPDSWFQDLPNGLPQLRPAQDDYELGPMYQPSHAEENPESKRQPLLEESPTPEPDATADVEPTDGAAEPWAAPTQNRRGALTVNQKIGWIVGILGLVILFGGLVLIFIRPILGVLGLLLGLSIGFCGLYLGRTDVIDAEESIEDHPAMDQDLSAESGDQQPGDDDESYEGHEDPADEQWTPEDREGEGSDVEYAGSHAAPRNEFSYDPEGGYEDEHVVDEYSDDFHHPEEDDEDEWSDSPEAEDYAVAEDEAGEYVSDEAPHDPQYVTIDHQNTRIEETESP